MKQPKRETPYEGDDIADYVNATKTYSNPSFAFKDAKYAEWFESDPETSDMKQFLGEMLIFGMPLITIAVFIAFAVVYFNQTQ